MARVARVQSKSKSDRILTTSEIESFARDEVKKAYIELLDGSVYYKNCVAAGTIGIFESGISIADQLRALATYIARTMCNEMGDLLYPDKHDENGDLTYLGMETVLDSMSSEAIEAIAMGIAGAARNERDSKEKRTGNGSRR